MPSIIHDSITIISHTGLGMSMFSLGMYGLHSSHILLLMFHQIGMSNIMIPNFIQFFFMFLCLILSSLMFP